jgi:hypothetical protein
MKSLFKFDSNSGAFAVLSCTWSPTAAVADVLGRVAER